MNFNNSLTWFILGILENLNQKNILLCVENHLNISTPMFTQKHICAKNEPIQLILTQPKNCQAYSQCLITTEHFALARL